MDHDSAELWKYVFRYEMDRLTRKARGASPSIPVPANTHAANAMKARELAKEAVRSLESGDCLTSQ